MQQKNFGLAVGTEGKNVSVPAVFITTFNHTMRYYFYTNFESGNPKPNVYDIPRACSAPGISVYNISPYNFIKTVLDLDFIDNHYVFGWLW